MRADNEINSAGAASLAPSLERMTQLTELDLSRTLDACNALMMLRAMGWDMCARGWSAWWRLARGEPRGGGACRQCDQSSWGSVAGTESRKDDAADVAVPLWYAACIGGSLRCEWVSATAGCAWMMLGAVG